MKPAWKDFVEKRANPLVWMLTPLYRKQYEAYKAQQAQQAQAQAQQKTVAKPAATAGQPNRTDALTQIAQGVSNRYQQGSLARPKYMSQGKVVAR